MTTTLTDMRDETFRLIGKSIPILHYKTGNKLFRNYNTITDNRHTTAEAKIIQYRGLLEQLQGNLQKAKETKQSRDIKKAAKKQLKDNFKELPGFDESNLPVEEPMEDFRVIIHVTYNRVWNADATKTKYPVRIDPVEATFHTTRSNLKKEVSKTVFNINDIEDPYYLQNVSEYSYDILPTAPAPQDMLDNPMFLGKPFTPSFLRYFKKINNDSFENTKDMCVVKILSNHLRVTEKWLLQQFDIESLKVYSTPYKVANGTTSRLLLEFCKTKNISLLGYNQTENIFVKHSVEKGHGSKKYRAIVFYMIMNHFYIINDEETVRHITQCAKDGVCVSGFASHKEVEVTSKVYKYHWNLTLNEIIEYKLDENDIVFFGANEDVDERGPINQYYSSIRPEILTDILKEYIQKTNDIPRVKMETRDRIKSLTLKSGVKLVLESTLMDRIPISDLMSLCEKNGIVFTNQSFSTFVLQIKTKFSEHKRKPFTSEQKQALLTKQNNKCTLCDKELTDKTPTHIDHIKPLSSGGSNDLYNLQVLCISCHIDKTREEHSSLEHLKTDEISSCFNIQTTKLMNSRHFVKNAFTHTLPKSTVPKKFKLFSADINKCRRNCLMNSPNDFYKFSVLDTITPFCQTDDIVNGLYYIETDNYFPMQGNKFYTKPMVDYCISLSIISKSQIIYKLIPSSLIKPKYFKDLIGFMMEALDDDTIANNDFVKKLGPNVLIGCMGRRSNTFFSDPKVCYRNKVDEIGLYYQHCSNPYIKNLNDDVALLTSKDEVLKLQTSFPVFMQVLDIEAIELHKLSMLIKNAGGIPVAVKTDAVVYYAPSKIDISPYFWDEAKTVAKYKHEKASLPKHEINNMCKLKLTIESNDYQTIYEDNEDFDAIAQQIIESEKGCLILGNAGTGKTTLINKIIAVINNDTQVKRLAPTNVSALLIKGETLDKFAYSYLNKNSKSKKYKNLKYIFVDEISMVKEVFYEILLSMKHFNPDLKFIICGDFNQLAPVKDIVNEKIYETSRALYELVDGCKLQLVKCRRSDSVLFDLCIKIINKESINIKKFETRTLTYLNVCYTNEVRRAINNECMKRYLDEHKPTKIITILKLEYDDNSQEYQLAAGMPIIARKTSSSSDVCNNEIFKVDKIMSDKIIISNDLKDKIEIPIDRINKLFNLAFAMTIHKSQGATMSVPYTIHEWGRLDWRLKYVGMSRSSDISLINISYK